MKFKPLVSEDDFRIAEAEIEAATRELSRQAQPDPTATNLPAQRAVSTETSRATSVELTPEIRTRIVEPGVNARILAWVGLKSGLRRVRTLNKISRTVDFGCASGLAQRSKELETVALLYAMACDPGTPAHELPLILGWIQALVVMTCPSVTPSAVRAV
ncbi:hypothetical protein GOB57_08715 [Sinorhizobium meliloti]|nr:hypothetical protein [Sinorhizobium meliloti]